MQSATQKGYKTSEFWTGLLGSLALYLNQSGLLGGVIIPVEGVVSIAGLLGSLIFGRSYTKAKYLSSQK